MACIGEWDVVSCPVMDKTIPIIENRAATALHIHTLFFGGAINIIKRPAFHKSNCYCLF